LFAFGLIDRAVNPATITVVGAVPIAVLVVVIAVIAVVAIVVSDMGDMGDDVLAHGEEVMVMVNCPLDPFGRVNFVGIECGDKFFTEGCR